MKENPTIQEFMAFEDKLAEKKEASVVLTEPSDLEAVVKALKDVEKLHDEMRGTWDKCPSSSRSDIAVYEDEHTRYTTWAGRSDGLLKIFRIEQKTEIKNKHTYYKMRIFIDGEEKKDLTIRWVRKLRKALEEFIEKEDMNNGKD